DPPRLFADDSVKPTPVRHYPFGRVSLADDPYKPVAPYPKILCGSFRKQRKLSTQNRNDDPALFAQAAFFLPRIKPKFTASVISPAILQCSSGSAAPNRAQAGINQ